MLKTNTDAPQAGAWWLNPHGIVQATAPAKDPAVLATFTTRRARKSQRSVLVVSASVDKRRADLQEYARLAEAMQRDALARLTAK